MIWIGTKQELIVFLENLNSKHRKIKFEHNISHSNISFFDTFTYKSKSSTLQQSYLHAHSDYLKSLK